jgi:hypothetical protein
MKTPSNFSTNEASLTAALTHCSISLLKMTLYIILVHLALLYDATAVTMSKVVAI